MFVLSKIFREKMFRRSKTKYDLLSESIRRHSIQTDLAFLGRPVFRRIELFRLLYMRVLNSTIISEDVA